MAKEQSIVPYDCQFSELPVSFEGIRKAAAELGTDTPLGRAVDALIDSARTNADDTVYVEKSADVCDWQEIALATLESSLAHSVGDDDVRDWFIKQGM